MTIVNFVFPNPGYPYRMDFNLEKYYLKSVSFFDLLSDDEADLINGRLLRKEYGKGEYLFRENTFSKGVYIVRRGRVKIFQTNSEGKQSIVYFYKRGEFFGYRPLLAQEPHPVSAAATDSVSIMFIPRDSFLEVLDNSPSLAKELLTSLTKEFSVWVNKLTAFSQYGVKERVALSLLILNKLYQAEDKNRSMVISISREDLAGFVGTAKETVVRMLRTFKDEKIITTSGPKIRILRHRALMAIVAKF